MSTLGGMGVQELVVSRVIAALPQDIWDVVASVESSPLVLRSIESVELLTEGEFGEGTRYLRTRSLLGRTETRVVTVVEADPPRHVVLESDFAGIGYRLAIELRKSGDHMSSRPRTRVWMRVWDHPAQDDPSFLQRILGSLGTRATEESLAQDLADIAAAVERPDTRSMVVVHRLFNRELTAGPDLVRGVPAGHENRAAVVADHLTVVLNALVDHHHGEDVLLWPLLRGRVELPAETAERMDAQHTDIHADVEEVRHLLGLWRTNPDAENRVRLARALARLAEEVRTHLEEEETEILPLVEKHLTRVEYERLDEHGRESLPRDKAAVLVQMILEGTTPSERALFIADFPRSTRLMITTVGARQYRRYVRKLRSA